MQNSDKSTARIECWNDLRDEKSTESHDKLFLTLTTRSVKNDDLTVYCCSVAQIVYKGDNVYS